MLKEGNEIFVWIHKNKVHKGTSIKDVLCLGSTMEAVSTGQQKITQNR